MRGAAALALVRYQPQIAATAVPATLEKDEQFIATDYAHYVERGKPKLTQQEIDPIVLMHRGQMKFVQAGEQLPAEDALSFLQTQAFRSVEDYSLGAGLVAGYQLWDRAGADPSATNRALAAKDIDVANRAEWILVKAGPSVLPAVRAALTTEPAPVRDRCIDIVAWQGDLASLPLLKAMAPSADTSLINWAIDKINILLFAVH